MKVVLDTNVLLISVPKKSPYCFVFDSLLLGKYELIINNDIISEYIEIIGEQSSPRIAENIIKTILTVENVVIQDVYFRWNLIDLDPDDNKFVDCAIASNAKYIVTEDMHFNAIKIFPFLK